MNETRLPDSAGDRPAAGPNPGILLLISLALTLASVVVGAVLSGGGATGSPFASTTSVAGRLASSGPALVIEGWLQVGSAFTLGLGSAVVYARQRVPGLEVPGPVIGFFGGTVAAVCLLASALCTWVLGRPEITAAPGTIHTLSFLSFALGSAGFVGGVGLLIAGIAVPGALAGTLSRPLAILGIVIAALTVLAWFAMVLEPLQFLYPIGRFAGMLWLVVAGFLLPRRTRAAATGVPAA